MTAFTKEEFVWDGSYWMYRGDHDLTVNMEVAHPDCHPSWVGKPEPTFVARFKHGYKPWEAWVDYLCKNVSVEEYVELRKASTPVHAMRELGYVGLV